MATIKVNFGEGGANVAPKGAQGSPDLATALRDIADDLAMLKAAVDQLIADHGGTVALVNELKADFNAVLAKLDLDAGVSDTDYAALHSTTTADATNTATTTAIKTVKG